MEKSRMFTREDTEITEKDEELEQRWNRFDRFLGRLWWVFLVLRRVCRTAGNYL
jgi:hypothetical protein